MTQFFKKFPVISYSNTSAVNLLARVNMSKMALDNKQAYYSYVVPDGMKPDHLSYNYYDNPDYVWLIALANQIVDPYYDYPITDLDLTNLIIEKYGSIANAQQKILYFQTNWASDTSNISVAQYNRFAQDPYTIGQQKYWAPNINQNNIIFEYVRKQEDWTVTTNKVVQMTIFPYTELYTENGYTLDTENGYDMAAPEGGIYDQFLVGELVTQNGVIVGTVSGVGQNYINIQHIAVMPTAGFIEGVTSNAVASVTAPVVLSQNIADIELQYWSPVSAYTYEITKNTANKSINLLNNSFAQQATKELKQLLLV